MTPTHTFADRHIAERCARPDAGLLRRIQAVRWTSHNFRVSAEHTTMDVAEQPLVGDLVKTRTIKRTLRRFMGRDGSLAGRRVIDLGCLEGGIALEMAREDMDVLGVEGRAANFEKCRLLADYFALPTLRFEHLDVKQLSPATHGHFDAALCLGLLYHLDDPAGFLRTLATMIRPGGVIFLDTHVAPVEPAALADCLFREALSELTEIALGEQRYAGRWFHEYDEHAAGSDNEWAAVSNHRSFWPTHDALLRALYHAGFQEIYTLNGCFEIDKELRSRREYSRAWYAAVR